MHEPKPLAQSLQDKQISRESQPCVSNGLPAMQHNTESNKVYTELKLQLFTLFLIPTFGMFLFDVGADSTKFFTTTSSFLNVNILHHEFIRSKVAITVEIRGNWKGLF